jgi:hypothetical protein
MYLVNGKFKYIRIPRKTDLQVMGCLSYDTFDSLPSQFEEKSEITYLATLPSKPPIKLDEYTFSEQSILRNLRTGETQFFDGSVIVEGFPDVIQQYRNWVMLRRDSTVYIVDTYKNHVRTILGMDNNPYLYLTSDGSVVEYIAGCGYFNGRSLISGILDYHSNDNICFADKYTVVRQEKTLVFYIGVTPIAYRFVDSILPINFHDGICCNNFDVNSCARKQIIGLYNTDLSMNIVQLISQFLFI